MILKDVARALTNADSQRIARSISQRDHEAYRLEASSALPVCTNGPGERRTIRGCSGRKSGRPKMEAYFAEVGDSAEPRGGTGVGEVMEPHDTQYVEGTVLIIAPWNYPMILGLQPLYGAISADVIQWSKCLKYPSATLIYLPLSSLNT
ncbi:hypothetical protein BD779DRAFT_1808181 [Infundibulicybe gibba]|nr:hypothetical protein BD779DRAFT_1808181 [Infundibulicybe gibba]